MEDNEHMSEWFRVVPEYLYMEEITGQVVPNNIGLWIANLGQLTTAAETTKNGDTQLAAKKDFNVLLNAFLDMHKKKLINDRQIKLFSSQLKALKDRISALKASNQGAVDDRVGTETAELNPKLKPSNWILAAR